MEDCNRFEALIPSYLDGELSEAQAAPLRAHLLACRDCRCAAQGERALKAWFPSEGRAEVPEGFAARIARRAFAGDTGEPSVSLPDREPAPILRFVLAATSVAAAVLLVLAVALRASELPESDRLQADAEGARSLDEVLRELDRVNEREAAVEAGADRR